jgi:plasmid stabilization system protein ParE
VTQYQIDITPVAEKEIEDFYLYIAEDSPANAEKWYFAIYDKIQTLTNFPTRSPTADEDCFYDFEIRNLIFGDYRVLYRIKKTLCKFFMSNYCKK